MAKAREVFEFVSVTVDHSGVLTLTGRVSGTTGTDCTFLLASRNGTESKEFAASLFEEESLARCSILLNELDFDSDSLLDFYFVCKGPLGETKTRVRWPEEFRRWLPYPTKFGNVSIKRKVS